MARPEPTGIERTFNESDLIVSKTDLNGRITYVNRTFCEVSGYSEAEALGQPHSLIRHPAMPRAAFALMWDTLRAGKEFFGYVVNLCKNGDHYWVLAHVTPSFDSQGEVIGYHSTRRVPDRHAVVLIEAIYADLLAKEQGAESKAAAVDASLELFHATLAQKGVAYDEFVLTI
ncbi:MAG: PAS domain-containing protein [Polyangiaceae bacterium]|nr:PAS domain-containing protein [Polyangiaceae bacterium]